jgi:hypothetical protein
MALLQLGLIGIADARPLIDQHLTFADAVTRWVVLIATLLAAGLLMAWIRRTLERERDETAHLAVVAERMRIARDPARRRRPRRDGDSLQAATGLARSTMARTPFRPSTRVPTSTSTG